MSNILRIIEDFKKPCPCGQKHETAIKDIRIGSGLVHKVGEILTENGFPENILLVADKNTFKAAEGIVESLKNFKVEYHIYDAIRVATVEHIAELEEKIKDRNIGVLSVGTGSVNDPCRVAAYNRGKKFCIFATAPSMDGFASGSSPIVNGGFKSSIYAKSPDVIIGDTKILAAAPRQLKSAGFGDMVAKYTALIDWQISALVSGEKYCERVAGLTRKAIDDLMCLADRVTDDDEETAGKIFESLLLTGIGMSYTGTSRPASGAEHIVCHLLECVQLRDGIIPNYHGEDIGVATLELLKLYNNLAKRESVKAHKENVDWQDIYNFFGNMKDEVIKLNTPTTITDDIEPAVLEEKWPEIRKIIAGVPSYEECLEAMKKAGCKITVEDIGKPQKLFESCMHYSPYMRRRLTLLRLLPMLDLEI